MEKRPDFSQLLIQKEIITSDMLKALQTKFNNDDYALLLYLLKNDVSTKKQLGRLWGDSIGVAYTDLRKAMFQKEIIERLPEEFARKNKVILIYQLSKAITAATFDPKNEILLNKIEQITKCQVSATFSFPDDIDEAIDKYYLKDDSLENLTKRFSVNKERVDIDELPSVISEQTKEYLVNNTKIIAEQAAAGKIPDLEMCNEVKNTIIEEVDQKLGVVKCINQLRIIDEYTYSHSVNTAILSSAIAKTLGYSANLIKEITLGALLHDIGKMKLPKSILNKSDILSNDENSLMKKHPAYGYQIVKSMGVPEKIAEIAHNHHERIDGNGYPRGLKREEISMFSQIVSIVDVYDTFVTDKPSKLKISHHEALNIMLLEGQRAFNFELLYKFVNLVYKEDFNTIQKTFKSVLYGDNN